MQTHTDSWWDKHGADITHCCITVLGALIMFVGKELMHRHRLPFIASPPRPTPLPDGD